MQAREWRFIRMNSMKMKKAFQKTTKQLPRVAKYFFDFLVVFAGVFLAFWLSDRKDKKKEEAQQYQIHMAIYEDLNSFYLSGREENERGFINLFSEAKSDLDSLIAIRRIPAHYRMLADYWNIDIINSLIESGKLTTVDIEVYKAIASYQVMHNVFLNELYPFNDQYEKYITANYDEDNIDFL